MFGWRSGFQDSSWGVASEVSLGDVNYINPIEFSTMISSGNSLSSDLEYIIPWNQILHKQVPILLESFLHLMDRRICKSRLKPTEMFLRNLSLVRSYGDRNLARHVRRRNSSSHHELICFQNKQDTILLHMHICWKQKKSDIYVYIYLVLPLPTA